MNIFKVLGIGYLFGCMLGHCYPVFMHFEGGKGVAVYAGMVLLYNPRFAVPIIALGTLLSQYRYNGRFA